MLLIAAVDEDVGKEFHRLAVGGAQLGQDRPALRAGHGLARHRYFQHHVQLAAAFGQHLARHGDIAHDLGAERKRRNEKYEKEAVFFHGTHRLFLGVEQVDERYADLGGDRQETLGVDVGSSGGPVRRRPKVRGSSGG